MTNQRRDRTRLKKIGPSREGAAVVQITRSRRSPDLLGRTHMKERPDSWMPWQIQRWRNSPRVLAMSLAAQGGFRNFLDVGWQHGGRVPNHPGAFQGFAMCKSAREWKRIEKEVLQMFTVSSDGQWLLNDTLTEQWDMASAKWSAII